MIATLAALVAAAGFQYQEKRDLMTDQVTHVASVDLGNRASLMFFCGSDTNGELVVNYTPGRILNDRVGGILLPFRNGFRFGSNEPVELDVAYLDDTVIIQRKAAWSFLNHAKTNPTVTIEYTDYRDSVYQHRIPLDGLPEAVVALESHCKRQ